MLEFYKSGDLDSCEEIAREILQAEPDKIAPLQYVARVHTNRRETELAKPYWNRLTALAPDLPEPFLQSARIARLENDWEACTSYIEEFVRQKPDHPEALGIQIQCFIRTSDFERIGRAFENLCRINPQAVPPLALLAVEHGMGIVMAKALSKAAEKDETAKALCVELARSARDAAIGFEIRNDPFSAASCYQTMQIYVPDSSYPKKALRRLLKPFLEKARASYREKSYADAIGHAEKCIKISPFEPEPYIIAGRSCAQLERHEDAFDFFGKEADRLWDNSWLVLNYARAAMRLKKSELAYAAFCAVRSRDDERSGAFHAECEKQLDRLSEAAVQNVQVLLDNRDILRACEKIIEFQKAGILLKNFGDLVDTIRDLGEGKLVELCDIGDKSALDYAKNLIQLDPGAKYAYRVAGRLLLENQRYAEASYYWAQLAKLNGKDQEPLLSLTRCYANLNNKSEAKKATSALLELDPDHEECRNILESLARMSNLNNERLS